MTLTAKDVAEIARLLDASVFTELHLEIDGMKLSVRRGAAPFADSNAAEPRAEKAAAESARAPAAQAAEAVKPADAAGLHAVTTPLLGTFYRAPKPGAEPYVAVGSAVEEDTIVGIVEVMKLMNTVRAGVRGTVTDILVPDGTLVEYGQALMHVRRADSHG